jgi:hypothetical protein
MAGGGGATGGKQRFQQWESCATEKAGILHQAALLSVTGARM